MNFIQETYVYASRVKEFNRWDWLCYVAWVGLMIGLFLFTMGFVVAGYVNGVQFPSYVGSVCIPRMLINF